MFLVMSYVIAETYSGTADTGGTTNSLQGAWRTAHTHPKGISASPNVLSRSAPRSA